MGAAKLKPEIVDPNLKTFDNVYNLQAKRPSPGDLKVALDDVLHAYKELGLCCALIAINLRLAFIEFSLMDINDGKVKASYQKIRDFFLKLRADIKQTMADNESDEKKYVLRFISPKIKCLLKILEKYKEFESKPLCEFGNDDRLCGLVFTDRRATAQVLAWYLKDLSKHSAKEHGFLRPSFVVGTSRSAFESVESRVYARKQTETIHNFRLKNLNLLSATSVLEEGIDIPGCNFVVRFDLMQTYTSFIQSMGRARKKGATFYAMLPDNDYIKQSAKIDVYQQINKEIIAYLKKNVEKIDADRHKINSIWEIDLIPPICPGGLPDSPKITMDSASDVVERYCMMLPSDGISNMTGISWWMEDCPNNKFQASLKLPLSGAIRGTIVGLLMKNKELAQQAVYMEAAQRLLDAGCFDSRLVPVHPVLPIKAQKYFKNLVPFGEGDEDEEEELPEPGELPQKEEGKDKQSFTENGIIYRKEWYSKRQPKVLIETPIRAGESVNIYKINFELVEPRENARWKNLYKFKDEEVGFAIITSQSLPNVGKIPLFGEFGAIHCTLSSLKLKLWNHRGFRSNEDLLKMLSSAQYKMFCEVLGLKHPFLQNSSKSSFVVVSIVKDRKEGWILNDEIEKELQELETVQKTQRPRQRDQSRSRRSPDTVSNIKRRFKNSVVFPWYKKPKTAYFVDSIAEDKTPLMEYRGATYKYYIETEYKVQIEDNNQPLLLCKLAGIAVGRSEKDPIQLNYLLQKFNKEDEFTVYMIPELVHSINLPAEFFVQLKLLPSVLHRLSRLWLCYELLTECSQITGWPKTHSSKIMPDTSELHLLSSGHETKKQEEEERRKRRVELRNEKFRPKKLKPLASNKQHIEKRELHYEFIHPNDIQMKDIQLFHEAVSLQHSASKLTLKSAEIEIIHSDLSLPSTFELTRIEDIELGLLDKPLDSEVEYAPKLLSIMEALSSQLSNEGLVGDRFQFVGSSFLSYAVSLFVFSNFPSYGEPTMVQFRNSLMNQRVLHLFSKRKGLPEILSGSDFHPDASWIPPGRKLINEYLGDIAASNKLHLNIFDELISQNPRDRYNKIIGMTRKELEEFVNGKAAQKVAAAIADNASAQMAQSTSSTSSDKKSLPPTKNKKKTISFFPYSTFTHTELGDGEIVGRLKSLIGTFFINYGVQGAYKALQWLNIQVPDFDGVPRELNDFNRVAPDRLNSATLSTGHELYAQFKPLEKLIEYEFKDKALLLQAFTHPSYPGHNLSDCYQRLEFLGDSILDLLITNHIYSHLLDGKKTTAEDKKTDLQNIKDLQNIRSALVNSVTFASLAVRYGFQKYFLSMSKSLTDMIDNFVVYQESVEHHVVGHFSLITDEETRGEKHIEVPKVLCDLFEALAGAIFIDSGNSLDTVWRIFYRLMQNELDVFLNTKPQAPINELKELMKKEEIEVKFQGYSGEKTKARGRECCRIDVGAYGHYFGMGTNNQRAKDAAAKIALKLIKEETEFIKDRDATKIMLLNC